jgi:enediyne biosynthesis protein E4
MFIDVDNDGRLDILSVNGHVYPEVDTYHLGSEYREPRLLYWNAGNRKFKDLSQQCGPGCTQPASSRGLAVGDLWNDGRMSAVVNNMGGQPMLLVNQSANRNNWLGVIAKGTKSNRDAVGAKVTVFSGGQQYVQEVRSGSSYISNNDIRLHFGLGSAAEIDHIEVRWPNGIKEIFPGGKANCFVTLVEGQGQKSTGP